MKPVTARCLVLACGNTLRSDDGIGPWLAAWTAERFRDQVAVRVVCRQQWTPELAEEIAVAEAVLFIDCSAASVPGSVSITAVGPASTTRGPGSHHQGAAELLALARGLYNSLPRTALLLTVGAASLELGEEYSEPVSQALPEACRQAEAAVLRLLG